MHLPIGDVAYLSKNGCTVCSRRGPKCVKIVSEWIMCLNCTKYCLVLILHLPFCILKTLDQKEQTNHSDALKEDIPGIQTKVSRCTILIILLP